MADAAPNHGVHIYPPADKWRGDVRNHDGSIIERVEAETEDELVTRDYDAIHGEGGWGLVDVFPPTKQWRGEVHDQNGTAIGEVKAKTEEGLMKAAGKLAAEKLS